MEKIIKLITANGHGNGGHFYSCRTISEYLSNSFNIKVSSIGKGRSEVIETAHNFDQHFNTDNKIQFIKRIRMYLKEFDIIHAYDEQSLSIAILFAPNKSKIAFTKCGGPNYMHQVRCNNMICFSHENFSDQKEKKLRNVNLIPNRIPEEDFQHTFYTPKIPEKIQIVRIGRISDYYEKSLRAGVALRNKLNDLGLSAEFTVIGVVESDAMHTMLKDCCTIINSEPKTVKDAVNHINSFDIVVGTGRSAVEAIARRKIVYLATQHLHLPVLLTTTNIENAIDYNLSERTIFLTENTPQYKELESRESFLKLFYSTTWQPFLKTRNVYSMHGIEARYKKFYGSCVSDHELTVRNLVHATRNLVHI